MQTTNIPDTRSFDDRDGFIWQNGRLVPWREAKTHVLNHGMHYASCVFEGIRVYGGKAFKLTEHNTRLQASAGMLGFTIPYSIEALDAATQEVLRVQNITSGGYVRPLAWRGSEQMAIRTNRSTIHVAIAAWEMQSYYAMEARLRGLKLCVADWRRPSPETAPTAAKAAGLYMICTLSKNKAEAEGFEDALMLDYRGYIAECTGANLFFVMDGVIHTPLPDCFLDGITRRTVIALARKRGLQVVERHIKPEEMTRAQEAFLTGTAAEVTPIASVEGSIGHFAFTTGPITRQLMKDYTALVEGGDHSPGGTQGT